MFFVIFYNFSRLFTIFVKSHEKSQFSPPQKFPKIKKTLGLEVQRALLWKCAQVAELDFFGAFPQTLWPSPYDK